MKSLLKEPVKFLKNFHVGPVVSKDSLLFDHICKNNPDIVNNLSNEKIISEANVNIIYSVANSKLSTIFLGN